MVPLTMKAIVLKEYSTNLSRVLRNLQVVEKEIRSLKDDEVLVKITAAPCNPSDIAFVRGMYHIIKPLPAVVGIEGSGKVVAAGRNPTAQNLVGKYVSCYTLGDNDGTWAEYFIARHDNCIPIMEGMARDQGACLSVNPFTAYALIDIVRQRNVKTIINTAAAGQIGQFIRALAKKENILIINTVRKNEHVELLKSEGESHVLNIYSDNFESELTLLAKKLNALIAFDAVGGETTGQILHAMPPRSQIILYGGLSSQHCSNINVLDVIFQNKTLVGFNLGDWFKDIGNEKFNGISSEIQEMIIQGIIHTGIQKTFGLGDAVRGLLQYIGHMSEGKILFVP
jgi:NADPH:quinone reductase-like Zn-dependent oxidoreductase